MSFDDRKKEYYQEYYKKNKQRYLGYVKKYQQSERGKNKIKQSKIKYFKSPRGKKWRGEYQKKWLSNKSNRLKHLFLQQMRRILKRFQEDGRVGLSDMGRFIYKEHYGVDFEAILERLKPLPQNLKDYDIDHIIPQSKFDFKNKEDIKKAWSLDNIRLVIRKENQKKGNK